MLYVKCLKSKKSGNLFVGLYKHLPYKELLITVDGSVISELLDVPLSRIRNLKENETIEVEVI